MAVRSPLHQIRLSTTVCLLSFFSWLLLLLLPMPLSIPFFTDRRDANNWSWLRRVAMVTPAVGRVVSTPSCRSGQPFFLFPFRGGIGHTDISCGSAWSVYCRLSIIRTERCRELEHSRAPFLQRQSNLISVWAAHRTARSKSIRILSNNGSASCENRASDEMAN